MSGDSRRVSPEFEALARMYHSRELHHPIVRERDSQGPIIKDAYRLFMFLMMVAAITLLAVIFGTLNRMADDLHAQRDGFVIKLDTQ